MGVITNALEMGSRIGWSIGRYRNVFMFQEEVRGRNNRD